MKTALQDYPAQQEKEEQARWKMTYFAKQLGLNIADLDDEELRVLIKALQGRRSAKRADGRAASDENNRCRGLLLVIY
jgi:hypothetical protein